MHFQTFSLNNYIKLVTKTDFTASQSIKTLDSPIQNFPFINISDPNNIKTSSFSKEKNKFSQADSNNLTMKSSRKVSDFSVEASNFSSNSLNECNINNKLSFSSNNLSNFNPNLLLQSPFALNSKALNDNQVLKSGNYYNFSRNNLICNENINDCKEFKKNQQADHQKNNDSESLFVLQRNLSLLHKNFVLEEKLNKEAEIDDVEFDRINNNDHDIDVEPEINIINSFENSENESETYDNKTNRNNNDTKNQNTKSNNENDFNSHIRLKIDNRIEEENKIKNLLEIKIKTCTGNTEIFSIEKHFCAHPHLLQKHLSEFIERKNLNKDLFSPIIKRINESVFSLNKILQQRINKKFLEDFIILKNNNIKKENNHNFNEDFESNKLEEILNKNFFSEEEDRKIKKLISDEDAECNNNSGKEDNKVSFLLYRTSVSTCQSEDEDEDCDLLLNKTL